VTHWRAASARFASAYVADASAYVAAYVADASAYGADLHWRAASARFSTKQRRHHRGSRPLQAHVNIRRHTSACVSIRSSDATTEAVGRCKYTSTYVVIRQHASAYVAATPPQRQ